MTDQKDVDSKDWTGCQCEHFNAALRESFITLLDDHFHLADLNPEPGVTTSNWSKIYGPKINLLSLLWGKAGDQAAILLREGDVGCLKKIRGLSLCPVGGSHGVEIWAVGSWCSPPSTQGLLLVIVWWQMVASYW